MVCCNCSLFVSKDDRRGQSDTLRLACPRAIAVDEETQMERLKKTYSDWEIHWENRNNPSEKEVDMIDLSVINVNLRAEDTLNFETEWLK